MKKLIYVVCGIAFFAVAILIGAVIYIVNTVEYEKNRSKTQAARDARWKERPLNLDAKSEEDINKVLDKINEQKKSDSNGKEA